MLNMQDIQDIMQAAIDQARQAGANGAQISAAFDRARNADFWARAAAAPDADD